MKKKSGLNRITAFDVIIALIMTLFCATIVLPFAHLLAVSLSGQGAVMRNEVSLLPKDFTFTNYKEIFRYGDFAGAYGNTLFVTIVGTALSLSTTAMAAYALSRRKIVGHKLFSTMIMITMFFGGGMIPTYMLVRDLGLLDTRWSMILPYMISTWNLIIMRSFFTGYPREIVESGYMDGLTDAGVFVRLVLPTSKAALATIGLYYAVAYWNSYMSARLYIRDTDLYPAQMLLQQMVSGFIDTGLAFRADETDLASQSAQAACILIVIAPIMCVYPFIQKYFVKGVMVGSIKG